MKIKINHYFLEIAVFMCGAVVMVYELAGSRVVAPFLGTSMYVWTSLIGVILGSLSLGYYYGGRIADKKPETAFLAYIILLAAVSIIASFLFRNEILFNLPRIQIRPEVKALFTASILFAPASILLGMVSPYAVKLRIIDLSRSGAAVGNLYALSTLGSIVGTFAAGFFMIPFFGTINIIYILAATLLLTGFMLLAGNKLDKRHIIALVLVLSFLYISYEAEAAASTKSRIIDIDTEYNRIWIYQMDYPLTGEPIIALSTDPYSTQSAMFLDDHDLVFDYTKFYRLADHFFPNLKNALMLGGCGYSFPKDFLKRFPGAKIDVVEIDPKITELAKKYFNLKEDPRLDIYHEDGRVFLNQATEKYDVILGDAFNSFASVPFQLATRETVQKEYDLLNDGGVIIMNMLSAVDGEKGKFFRSEYATYRSVFPQVHVFALDKEKDPAKVQNLMLVALKSDIKPSFTSTNPEYADYLDKRWTGKIEEDMPVLTDNYAPVDYYMNKTVQF